MEKHLPLLSNPMKTATTFAFTTISVGSSGSIFSGGSGGTAEAAAAVVPVPFKTQEGKTWRSCAGSPYPVVELTVNSPTHPAGRSWNRENGKNTIPFCC